MPFVVMLLAAAGCRDDERSSHGETSPPADVQALTVPAGQSAEAQFFQGHWYQAFGRKVSWHEARRICEEMGGYLACIESDAEQRFVADLAGGRYLYLGATDEYREGSWEWINGEPVTYSCWMDGQPNNYGGNEHYLATYDEGMWVDVADEGEGFWMPTGFLCEWDRAPTSQPASKPVTE
jgi:hypothetical protein